jgi:hypothetical protein
VLALFSTLSRDLGNRLAKGFLEAFVQEHLVPEPEPGQPLVPRPPPTASGGAGTLWRFSTLDGFLASIPDLLVGALVDRLPRVTPWLMLLFTSPPRATCNNTGRAGICKGLVSASAPSTDLARSPRPPAEPPPRSRSGNAGSRPHLARRMLQRLPGGNMFSSQGSPKAQAAGGEGTPLFQAVAAAPEGSPGFNSMLTDQPNQGVARGNATNVPVRPASVPPCDNVAQGKVSWWRRNRSKSASRANEASVAEANADVDRDKMFDVSTLAYFYDAIGPGARNDSTGRGEETNAPKIAQFAANLRRSFSPTSATTAARTAMASSMVLVLGIEELPSGGNLDGLAAEAAIQGPQGPMLEVVVLGLALPSGAWLSVAVPACALLPPQGSEPTKEPLLEVARATRRSLESELATLGAYLSFLDTVTGAHGSVTSAATAGPGQRVSAPREGVPHS